MQKLECARIRQSRDEFEAIPDAIRANSAIPSSNSGLNSAIPAKIVGRAEAPAFAGIRRLGVLSEIL